MMMTDILNNEVEVKEAEVEVKKVRKTKKVKAEVKEVEVKEAEVEEAEVEVKEVKKAERAKFPPLVQGFMTAYTLGLRSQSAIQVALVNLCADYGVRRDDYGVGADTRALTDIVNYLLKDEHMKNMQTISIISYLENICMFSIDKKAKTLRARRGVFYDVAWLNNIKSITWAEHAATLMQWKVPTVSFTGIAVALAKRALLDDKEPDFNAILQDLKAAYKKAKDADSIDDWLALGVKQGKIVIDNDRPSLVQ
jgi:hypothetical protein